MSIEDFRRNKGKTPRMFELGLDPVERERPRSQMNGVLISVALRLFRIIFPP
jgi:hypothetical protein